MATRVRLDDLIDRVRTARPDGDPLDRLAEAVATADELTAVADHLIGHFVDQARDAGLSWTQIGERLGVTKQAVRKRFAPDDVPPESSTRADKLFGRYTGPAKHAVVLAQDASRRAHHHYIGTEHLLLGVCRRRTGLGARVLTAAGSSAGAVERLTADRLGGPSTEVPERIPFTAKSKKALELTLRAALRLGHDHVTTGHLLLGLSAERTGLAAVVLTAQGLDTGTLETTLVRLVADGGRDA